MVGGKSHYLIRSLVSQASTHHKTAGKVVTLFKVPLSTKKYQLLNLKKKCKNIFIKKIGDKNFRLTATFLAMSNFIFEIKKENLYFTFQFF